jgi:hypothetical protein
MSTEEVRWITLDRFTEILNEYGVPEHDISRWIGTAQLTLRYEQGIEIADDERLMMLMYRIKKGKDPTGAGNVRAGIYIRTINKNDIRRVGKLYHVYDIGNRCSIHRTLDAAIRYANEHDTFVTNSKDSIPVRLSKDDVNKIIKALAEVNYQGKINNKLHKAKKKHNDRRNNINGGSNGSSDIHDTNVVHSGQEGIQTEQGTNTACVSGNTNNRKDSMKRTKQREVKFSKETRKYMIDKYNISSSRLTYLFCYTGNDNIQALELIKEAGDYQRDVVDKRKKEIESEMYVKPIALS